MKIKLKPLNRVNGTVPHGDDLTDAVALKRMFPQAAIVQRGCQGHIIVGDKGGKVIAVLPPNTQAFPTVLYGQTAMLGDIIAAGRGAGGT
jgi:hypothetical protein